MADRGIPPESMDESRSATQPTGLAEPPPSPPGAGLIRPARGFVRFLYSSNPFYILSADLVFVGLKISFGSRGPASQTWALLFGLAGYTLLMAVTACYLIRAGKLWDDLRSLLILIVMMFMTMAMSGDDTLAANPAKGTLGCLGGLLFAAIVTETILRTIRLRLPGWYRAAYYLILALIFLYPILLIPLASEPDGPSIQWALFGFAVMSGLVLTALVPAARRGAAYVAENGSPWRWPLFPWSLFVIMAGGLGVRSYSLCVCFHYILGSQTIFGPFFLVPIGLAVSLVWLEIGIASGRRHVMVAASTVPLFLVALCFYGYRYEPVYLRFLDTFIGHLKGSPPYLTLIAALMFYGYAAARKVPLACELMCVALVGLALIGPRAVTLNEIDQLWSIPLLAAGLLLGSIAWRRRLAIRALTAAFLLVIGCTALCEELWLAAPLASVSLHLAILALLILGAGFDNWLRDLAQTVCPIVLSVLGVAAVYRLPAFEPFVPVAVARAYPLFAIVSAAAYGFLTHQALFKVSALFTLASWVVDSGLESYRQLRRLLAGLDELSAGIALFIVALAISLRKAGLVPRIDFACLIRRTGIRKRAVAMETFWELDPLQDDEIPGAGTLLDPQPGDDVRQSSP